MTEGTENLILEHLRTLRNETQNLRSEMREGFTDIRVRVGSLEEHVAGLRRDLALIPRRYRQYSPAIGPPREAARTHRNAWNSPADRA